MSGVFVLKIVWIRGNEFFFLDGRMSVKNGIFVIVEVEIFDSGDYICIVENIVGIVLLFLNVIVGGK